MLKCKFEDVNVTAWLLYHDQLIIRLKMFPVFDQARLQIGDVMNLAAVHTLLQFPRDPVD